MNKSFPDLGDCIGVWLLLTVIILFACLFVALGCVWRILTFPMKAIAWLKRA